MDFVSLFGVSIVAGVLFVSRTEGVVEECGLVIMMVLLPLRGFIPAASATGIASDLQRPLARFIVYGLCSSLFLTLLAFPSLCRVLEPRWLSERIPYEMEPTA